ncbi:MAG: DinB family protein [Ferruginibacter sp.]
MKQVNWFERNFEFNITQNIFPSLIERLQGTPIRLEHKLKSIPAGFFPVKIDDSWSIKENIGHLTDLEPLWQTRLQEIIKGEKVMSAADLQNTKTNQQKHNDRSVEALLNSFIRVRKETIDMLENIDETIIFKSALHPRLNKPMRTMDLFIFVAEHDDHHLTRISEIAKILASKK